MENIELVLAVNSRICFKQFYENFKIHKTTLRVKNLILEIYCRFIIDLKDSINFKKLKIYKIFYRIYSKETTNFKRLKRLFKTLKNSRKFKFLRIVLLLKENLVNNFNILHSFIIILK